MSLNRYRQHPMNPDTEDSLSSRCECLIHPYQQEYILWDDLEWITIIERAKKDCPFEHPPLKDLVLVAPVQGTTPLLLACSAGNVKVVNKMIREWKVDVNKAGTFLFKKQRIEGATPLFVAVVHQFEEIVSCLLANGANVAVRTSSSSGEYADMTPLHAALRFPSDLGESSVIWTLLKAGADPLETWLNGQPLWKLLIPVRDLYVIRSLINGGMDVNQRDTSQMNRTWLHFLAKHPRSHCPERVISLLLSEGADFRLTDDDGLTPLHVAALELHWGYSESILKCFLTDPRISREEKIEALELAGSSILFHTDYFPDEVFNYWAEATALRQEGENPKFLQRMHTSTAIEWTTHEELERLRMKENPLEYRMQSLLVRLRILSGISAASVIKYFWPYFYLYVRNLYEERNFDYLLEIYWAFLEEASRFEPQKNADKKVSKTIVSVCFDVIHVLGLLRTADHPLLNAHTVSTALQLMLEMDRHVLILTGSIVNKTSFNRQDFTNCGCRVLKRFEIICKLIDIIASRPELVTDDVMTCIRHWVNRNETDSDGRSLLHVACSSLPPRSTDGRKGGRSFPSEQNEVIHTGLDCGSIRMELLPAVTLLLQAGADPNAVDNRGNSSLHLLGSRPYEATEPEVIRQFVAAGYNKAMLNERGQTAMKVFDLNGKIEFSITENS